MFKELLVSFILKFYLKGGWGNTTPDFFCFFLHSLTAYICSRLRLGQARIERLASDCQPGLHIIYHRPCGNIRMRLQALFCT